MRGSPLLRAAAVLAALLLLLVPLRSFTASRNAAAPPPARTTPGIAAHLEIVSTKAPFAFEVQYLGKTIWKGESAGNSSEVDVKLQIPKEGIDLGVDVSWHSPGVAAAKLTVTHGDESAERTIWGDGEAADVLTFP